MPHRDNPVMIARDRLRAGRDLDEVLRLLRANGFTMIDSIKATMELKGVSVAEAKEIVHASGAWSDRREAHDAFHRALEETVEAVTSAVVRRS